MIYSILKLGRWVVFCGMGLVLSLCFAACSPQSSTNTTEKMATCTSDFPILDAETPFPPAGYTGPFYTGPLFDSDMQLGDSGSNGHDLDQLISNMDRNNVVRGLMMFGINASDEFDLQAGSNEGIDHMRNAIVKAPCRIIPYFVRGTGNPDSLEIAYMTTVLDTVQSRYSGQLLRGIGELEIYKPSWGKLDADDPQLLAIYDLANTRGLHIMAHWAGGPDSVGPLTSEEARTTSEKNHLATIFEQYPNIKFLFHLFPTHIETSIFDLMDTYTNFYFSVDVDHIMQRIPWECGLLDCYENDSDAIAKFKAYFDSNFQAMVDQAVARYKPLIEAHPNQFMWGSENVGAYSFHPDVYDRSIAFSRAFIAQLNADVREKFAYQNAERVFGSGVKIQ